MAKIHVVPSWPAAGGTTQLIATLTRAFEDGVDLGSRKAHIDALVLSLAEAVVVMRCEAEPVLQLLDDDDPMKRTARASLDRVVDEVQHLITLAQGLPY